MIPTAANSDYPKFVADQVLTSDNLNDLFGYLDEQGRMTRTNLSGIGIVCGLEVKTAPNGSSITITKGVGVTSSGYLVSVPEITYTKRTTAVFDAVKCEYYSKFVNIAAKTQNFDLWELKQEAEAEGTTLLNNSFLSAGEKVVLIFVELLEENNKNCDPNSCDDKGTKVTVNIRPLLVTKAIAETLITPPVSINAASFNSLVDLPMPRWNIVNTNPVNTNDIVGAYTTVLTQNFISSVQSALSQAYVRFSPVLGDKYPSNPFTAFNLVSQFAFLYNGSINKNQSLHIQYYYDLFSDLIAAYKEFCITGNEVLSVCSPNESLFPRHLLLGEVFPLAGDAVSTVRHHFIFSPLFQRKDLWLKLISLFRRMDFMLKNFSIPPIATSGPANNDTLIKITPSNLSDYPLSAKAIPYYYDPVSPANLVKNWSYEKFSRNRANHSLSYNAALYTTAADNFVRNPLQFDIEPYNFLRVEGITGKAVVSVLETIKARIKSSRLPIKVVALATGTPKTIVDEDACCCLSDLELQYQLLRKQLLCCLKESSRFFGSLEKRDDGKGGVITKGPRVTKANEEMVRVIGKILTHELTEDESAAEGGLLAAKNSNVAKAASPQTEAKIVQSEKKGKLIINAVEDPGENSYAMAYLGYQGKTRIPMESLPAPKSNAAEENISHYLLIILDELEELAELLSEEDIAAFDTAAFASHATILDTAYVALTGLLTGYHSKGYQVEKIKINTDASHKADVDKIAAAMAIISDTDAFNLITLIRNSSPSGNETTISLTALIASLQANKNNYAAQVRTIRVALERIKDVMVPVNSGSLLEPAEGTYTSEYSNILAYLRSSKCKCDIDKLKFLMERYREQRDQLTDLNNFSVYTQHHPGIEHKAGVTKGGTLIIVYKGANDPRADILTGTVVADFYLPYTCSSDCTPIEVTVQEAPPPVNIRPVAKPGSSLYIETPTTTSVTLDGSFSTDSDGNIIAYLWEKLSGPAAGGGTLVNANAAIATVSNFFVGVYTYKLTVTDNDNATNEDIVTITVADKPNTPPIAVATTNKSTIIFPTEQSVQLSGQNSTDPDPGATLSYAWVLDPLPNPNNSGVVIATPALMNTTVTFTKTGLFVFKLTVTDNKSVSATDKVFILVSALPTVPNKMPVAIAVVSPASVVLPTGQTVSASLDGTNSFDPDGNPITSFKWALQNGVTGAQIVEPNKEITEIKFSEAGTYLITLTVADVQGATANDYVIVTVNGENKQQAGSCAPLGNIITEFNGLGTVGTAAGFKNFKDQYIDYSNVESFYEELEGSGIASLPIPQQIDFFNTKSMGARLEKWISNLAELIIEKTPMRPYALTMLNLHAQLAYYVECIQKNDIDKTKMTGAFEALLRILDIVNQVLVTFTNPEKNMLKALRSISVSESDRVVSKGEQDSKRLYFKALSDIIEKIPATL